MRRFLRFRVLVALFVGLLFWASVVMWFAKPRYDQFMCGLSTDYTLSFAMRLYSNDQPDKKYPPMSSISGRLFPDADVLYPKYLSDKSYPPFCSTASRAYKRSSIEEQFERPTHLYLGYALLNETELLAFLESYPSFVEQEVNLDDDLPAPAGRGSFGGDTFLRLISKPFEGKIGNTYNIPEIIELPDFSDDGFEFRHPGNGGFVQFFHGGCRYIEFGAEFPMTREVIEKIREIKAMYED